MSTIKLLTPYDQQLFADWYNARLLTPGMSGMFHGSYGGVPEIHSNTWERAVIANMSGGAIKAVVVLDFNRNDAILSASTLMICENAAYAAALLDPTVKLLELNQVKYVDAKISEKNTASLRLAHHFLGEPWGQETNGIMFQGEVTDALYFRGPFDRGHFTHRITNKNR